MMLSIRHKALRENHRLIDHRARTQDREDEMESGLEEQASTVVSCMEE